MKNYVLFDISQGTQNLGDFIIMDSIMKEMNFLFEGNFLTHFSTHTPIARFYHNFRRNMQSRACDSADKKFICGANTFKNSLLRICPDWNINHFNCKYYKNSIAIGVGMDMNSKKMDSYTKMIYKNILSKEFVHSVRDERTKKMLEDLGFKAINTGCPTLWSLDDDFCKKIPTEKAENVIFTLTFYDKDQVNDQKLIDILKNNYNKLFFWVQGSEDYEYFKTFQNIEDIEIISPNLESYKRILQKDNIEYVGTRLHAGIFAMKNMRRAIILNIDNRARDMSETYNLNTIDRDKIYMLEEKINSKFETKVNIDKSRIREWKNQFKDHENENNKK